jgi:hypothetical protein
VRVTASKRGLLAHCSHWAQEGVPWDETTSEAAQAGSEAHAGFEAEHDGTDIPLSAAARAKVMAASPLLQKLRQRGESWAEVAFAWDPATGAARTLGKGRDAYAKAQPGELCGTADLLIAGPYGPEVYDYKTGREADAKPQLETLALMAYRAGTISGQLVTIGVIYVDEHEARLVAMAELDALDLEDVARRLRKDLARDPAPKPGPWCRELYCPARAQCPATQEALLAIQFDVGDAFAELVVKPVTRSRGWTVTGVDPDAGVLTVTPPVHRLSPVIQSPEHAAWSLTALGLVEEAAKVIRAKLRAYADEHGGIPLPDGQVWSASSKTVEKAWLAVPGVEQLIADAGAAGAIEKTVSWAGLARVVGKNGAELLRSKMRQMGAVKLSSYPVYEARKAKP